MKTLLGKTGVYALCACFALSGCMTGGGGAGGLSVGPKLSSLFTDASTRVDPSKPRLDVIVPVFDPGLSDAAENYEEEGVWPELRRAEANRFAHKLKTALEDTGAFGAVRVAPDASMTGDLYVLGEIVESDGEDVEIELRVVDISGREWFDRSFDHTVNEGFYKNIRNDGKDPYDPMFEEAANRIVEELDDQSSGELTQLRRLTELRFGASFSEKAFAPYLKVDGSRVSMVSFPADGDPMLRRIQAVRVRDQLFVDGLQTHYRDFSDSMAKSYRIWQEDSLLEQKARREANRTAAGEAALGVLAIGLGVLSAVAGSNSTTSSGQTAGAAGAIVGGIVGARMIASSFQTSEEAAIHRDALEELGRSLDLELAPQVVAFEQREVQLSGNAREQFAQWRAFLQRIFEEEETPKTQI